MNEAEELTQKLEAIKATINQPEIQKMFDKTLDTIHKNTLILYWFAIMEQMQQETDLNKKMVLGLLYDFLCKRLVTSDQSIKKDFMDDKSAKKFIDEVKEMESNPLDYCLRRMIKN